MKVIDPGHLYLLRHLDGVGGELLRFVKRVGPGYPGNNGDTYPGTQIQEVLRALIDRIKYVSAQAERLGDLESLEDNAVCESARRAALYYLEVRAARRHGRECPKWSTTFE